MLREDQRKGLWEFQRSAGLPIAEGSDKNVANTDVMLGLEEVICCPVDRREWVLARKERKFRLKDQLRQKQRSRKL